MVLFGILAQVASPATAAVCAGDCNDNCDVTVDEIVAMVALALEGGTDGCANADLNGDGRVDVSEIIVAINDALVGCGCWPPAVCGDGWVERDEDCDDGGICIGGNRSGTACASEGDCGLDQDGVCVGGPEDLRGCESDFDCGGGLCRRCKPFGGDGCSSTCTTETTLPFSLKTEPSSPIGGRDKGMCLGPEASPISCDHAGDCTIPGGFTSGVCSRGSTAAFFSVLLELPVSLSGQVPLVVGEAGDDGLVPVAIRADDVDLPRSRVGDDVACVCPRVAVGATCGGVLFHRSGVPAAPCKAGFAGAVSCPVDLPCTAIHGPGNAGSGWIGCQGLAPGSVGFAVDCRQVPPEDPMSPMILPGDTGGPGAAYITLSTAIGIDAGACEGDGQALRADGQYCTDDGPLQGRGTLVQVPLVTGTATATVQNAGGFPGDVLGPYAAFGAPFTCGSGSVASAEGAVLAGAYSACEQPTLNDLVVLLRLEAE